MRLKNGFPQLLVLVSGVTASRRYPVADAQSRLLRAATLASIKLFIRFKFEANCYGTSIFLATSKCV